MKAVQIKSHGDPRDVLEVADVPAPNARLHVVGTEGVGGGLAVGRDVENVKVGDRVLAPPLSQIWREKMIVPASGLFPLPDGDPYQFSMLSSNPPTAAL